MTELYPLNSYDEDVEEEDFQARYHRVDSMEETSSERFGLVQGAATERTLHVENNLDSFFQETYNYYLHKGFGSIISTSFVNLASVAFTVSVATFLLIMLDWSRLSECQQRVELCASLDRYIVSPFENQTPFKRMVVFGSSLGVVYCIQLMWSLYKSTVRAFKYRRVYRLNGVTTRDLQTMTWSSVVTKLKEYQKKVYYVKNGMQVNAFTIALRIMRKENYKIAFFCMNVLPLGSPDIASTLQHLVGTGGAKSQKTNVWWMGNGLEMNLDLAIFDNIIDPKTFQLRKDLDAQNIRRNLKTLGIVNLLLLPVIFTATFFFFFFKYAEELHSKRNYLGPRWWTPHSLWILREFNELPHVFHRRLHGSLRPSEKYLRMFPNPVPVVLARGAAFILGGLVAVLLVLGLVDDSVLLHVSLGEHNLVWFAAVLSSLLAAARSLIPPSEEESIGNPNLQMRRIVAFTHMLPDHWRGKAHTFDVKENLESLLPFRVVLLLRELLCVLCTPYILYFVLPRYSDDVVQFFKEYTSKNYSGVGDICSFSLMDLAKDGDKKWTLLLKALPLSSLANASEASFRSMDPLVESKLEKSWLNFKIQYSADNCGISDALGEDLLRKVKDLLAERRTEGSHGRLSDHTVMMMSASIENLTLVPQQIQVFDELNLSSEDIFWFLEQLRDEELRKRLDI